MEEHRLPCGIRVCGNGAEGRHAGWSLPDAVLLTRRSEILAARPLSLAPGLLLSPAPCGSELVQGRWPRRCIDSVIGIRSIATFSACCREQKRDQRKGYTLMHVDVVV